ncbi:hypothetical protein ATANTOWER_025164 [Ataeniobius toweri]|uniref:Uncharacterized protein n=1 Tax=Ataeniobius toweri TaxID=208326 RepID=A0ABU7BBS2_9TELE|nr:hypothetical protein [Ataeniobius toweri]
MTTLQSNLENVCTFQIISHNIHTTTIAKNKHSITINTSFQVRTGEEERLTEAEIKMYVPQFAQNECSQFFKELLTDLTCRVFAGVSFYVLLLNKPNRIH